MKLRFRRTLRLLPGIKINLSKRGVSTSVGVRGAHITVGHGQVRETVGLPGTGLSYTHVEGAHESQAARAARPVRRFFWIALVAALALCALLRALP